MKTLKLHTLALFTLLCTARVHAAGIEDAVGGAMVLGRGGAGAARVNDFMALVLNPANLARAPGGGDLGFELRFPVLHACFDRDIDPNVEYKQPGAYEGFEGTESFGRVCNEAIPGPTANLGWSQGFGKWGYGIGVFTPAAVGGASYGRDTNVSWYPAEDEPFQVTTEGVESPNRQMGLKRDGVVAFLMLGAGWAPIPQLRLGASVGWGVASVYNKSVVSVLGGTFRDQEIMNELRANDYFIPRAVVSAAFTPTRYLEWFGTLNYQGDINAKGSAELTANGISGAPLQSCGVEAPGTHCKIDGVKLNVPFPTLETTFGVRIAVPRGTKKEVYDPMTDEYLDFEVDGSWAQTSKVDQFRVNLHNKLVEDEGVPKIQFANTEMATSSYPRQSTSIPKNWRDTWSVRAGSDVNVIPGKLALRAGWSWTQRATPVETMNIDYWPVQKIGMHLGATVRFGRVKLTAAYARLFYQTVQVRVGTGQVKDIASVEELKATGVNEGRFTARQNIFSLQLNAAF
ncbi:MAG: outer membrane protein transport protein [Polyangiales bacterium]